MLGSYYTHQIAQIIMKTALTLLLSASVLGLGSTVYSQDKAVAVDKKAISAKKPLGNKAPRGRLDAFG